MSNKWACSDDHLGHKLVTMTRGFSKASEKENVNPNEIFLHNEAIIENHNKLVKPDDTVWCLGDIVFSVATYLDLIGRLNGKKYLVLGNHEHKDLSKYVPFFKGIFGFADVGDWIFSHLPIHPSQFDHRFSKCINVHGHIHKGVMDKPLEPIGRYYNVNIEFHDLKPVNFDELPRWKQ